MNALNLASLAVSACVMLAPIAASAKDDGDQKPPRRTRIALGPQLTPSYPGSDSVSLRPLVDVSRASAGEPYRFEAADESFGFALLRSNGFSFGPSLGFEGRRRARDVGTDLPDVGISIEVGGFVQQEFGPSFRLRAEARQGVTGHEGFISVVSADYVLRDGLKQEIAFGPRVTVTDARFQDAYFSVRPEDAAAAGLPAYRSGGGIQAVGATLGYIRQFSPRWGTYAYAKYDRLVGDPANSPIVTSYGSRDQFYGGIALTYTFGAVER